MTSPTGINQHNRGRGYYVEDVRAAYCNRGEKEGFVKYFTNNPIHFRTLWKTGTPEQAWRDIQGITAKQNEAAV